MEPFSKYLRYNIDLSEALSFMFESLPIAIAEFDESKGKASTCWGKVFKRVAMRQSRAIDTVGSVLVPNYRRERFSASNHSHKTEFDLEQFIGCGYESPYSV